MTKFVRKALCSIIYALTAVSSYGYDFELPAGTSGMQKLRYTILSSIDQTVSVEGGTTGIIPCTVTYNNKIYTVTEIGRYAFNDVNITDFRLPLSLKVIRENAFGWCKASIVAIPDGVETIEEDAFWNSSIETIIVGSNVKTIGAGAFYGCSNLKTLIMRPQKAPSHDSRNYSIGNTQTSIIVPQLQNYSGTSFAKVVRGSMIEPISFTQTQYEYCGVPPELNYTLRIASASPQKDMSIKNCEVGEYEQIYYIGLSDIIPSYRFSDYDGYGVFPNRGLDIQYNYEIVKKTLNLTISNHERTYGDNNPSTYNYSINGFVPGEDESHINLPIIFTTNADVTSDVGNYDITCSPTARNYKFAVINGTLKITEAPLKITVKDSSRIYGDENPIFLCDFNGLRNNDTPIIEKPLIFKTATIHDPVGLYDIECIGGKIRNYNIIEFNKGKLTVTKASLLLHANDLSRLYYQDNPAFSFGLEGLKNDDTADCLSTQPQFKCDAVISSDCGNYPITPYGAEARNYDIAYKEGSLIIKPDGLILVATNVSREYGESNPVFRYEAIGLKGQDELQTSLINEPTLSTLATAQSDVGEYSITITGASSKNYTISYRQGILTVVKAPLTVIADNAEKVYGDSNPQFTRSYNGFKLNDTESTAFTSLPRITCNASKNSDVGEYPISVDGGTSRNYQISEYRNGVLRITKAPLVLTATNKSRLYYEANPQFDFTLSGLKNSDSKSCISTLPTYSCTADKTSNAGEYSIVPSNAFAKNYTIEYRNGTLTINQRSLTASVGNYTRKYNTENPLFEVTYTGFVNDENASVLTNMATVSCSATKTSDVGSYTLTPMGGNATNYVVSQYYNGTLTIEKADQTLTWEQDLSNVEQYSQIALNAVSSVGLPVLYEMSPNNVATLYDNSGVWYLDCYGSGTVSIRAVQNGNINYNAASMIAKTLVVSGTGGDPSNPQIYLNVESAGSLPSMIAENRKYQIKNLRLTGKLNGTDINFLREMAGSDSNGNTTTGILETLDISGCTIVSGGRSYYRSYQTSNYKVSDYMFYNCKELVNLLLPDNSTTIGSYALANCNRLTVLSMPNSVTSFGQYAFSNDISLLRIPMPNELTTIGDMAFYGCNGLTEITIPQNVRYLGDGILNACQNISKINVEKGNSSFASQNGVLYTSALDELLIFPVNYASSEYNVIDGVKRIAPYAFVNSKKLTDIILPESITTIGKDAFIGCVNLNSIQVQAINPPLCQNDCFEAVSKTRCELRVPKGCYSYYWVAPVWSEFNRIVEQDYNSLEEIISDGVKVTAQNGIINILNAPKGQIVCIYQTNGTLIYNIISDGNPIQYHCASKGTIIVVVGNNTYKLFIK